MRGIRGQDKEVVDILLGQLIETAHQNLVAIGRDALPARYVQSFLKVIEKIFGRQEGCIIDS